MAFEVIRSLTNHCEGVGNSKSRILLLEIGELEIVTSEFSEGKIFAAACGKRVLCVVSGPEVNIGLIRLVMKKQGVQLADELDKFLAVEPTVPTKDELDEEDLKSALAELERV